MISLTPRVHPTVRTVLQNRDAVFAALAEYGSPLHLVFPEVFVDNVASLRDVLDEAAVRSRLCFAHKANQSSAFVEAAAASGVWVDVASPAEWHSARAAGVTAQNIVVTGPKGAASLDLWSRSGAVIVVDNTWELAYLVDAAQRGVPGPSSPPGRIQLLVRFSGFGDGVPGRLSRFGVPLADRDDVLTMLLAHADVVEFLGPAFHLDSNAVPDRLQAIAACLDVFEEACVRGLAPSVLDIGGGLGQVFLKDPREYETYVEALRCGLLGQGPPMTWDGASFGFRRAAGTLVGTPTFHRYGNVVDAPEFLASILHSSLGSHGERSVAQVVRDNGIDLWLEPGRALVDQAGITLATVQFSTRAGDGSTLVHLDLSRDKVCAADQEVLMDPVLLYRSEPEEDDEPVAVFLAGNLCLERDVVYQHLTYLPRLPKPGDVVAFVNTAAYQMDLSASAALMRPLPARAAVMQGDAGVRFVPDRPRTGEGARCSTDM